MLHCTAGTLPQSTESQILPFRGRFLHSPQLMTHRPAHPFAVRFVLRDLSRIEPWGTAPDCSLSWFGLTDGAYCIETPAGRLLEYREAPDPDLGVAWCTYAVARLWEDLTDLAPRILEPVPPDVSGRLLAWIDRGGAEEPPDDDTLYNAWLDAIGWWGERQLDIGYLRNAPRLHLWRVGDVAHLRWRAREPDAGRCPYTVWRMDADVPISALETALADFNNGFLAAMRQRCEALLRDGWRGAPCDIDADEIMQEQVQREAEALTVPASRPTDWDAVREGLEIMGA